MEEYLRKIERCVDDEYGQQIRKRFADSRGSSELAMLACPSGEELGQLTKAVAIMTPSEKAKAADLTDEQIQKIAGDAGIDAGIFAIFINGYALERNKQPQGEQKKAAKYES